MSEGTSSRRSIYGNIEKSQRRSFFEKSNLTSEKEKTSSILAEWDKYWGNCHSTNYAKGVIYPEEYVQKITEEQEMWSKFVDDINKKGKIIESVAAEEFDSVIVINKDVLTIEHNHYLGDIDSRINEYFKKSTTLLKDFQVYKRMQEMKLDKIEKERKMVEAMIVATK